MEKHDIRESNTHYGCIRCGKCTNKHSRHSDRTWKNTCIPIQRPYPKHDIQLRAGGWRCTNCNRKGNTLFHTACNERGTARYRIKEKRPPRPGEHGYGKVKHRIVKKRPPREGEPGNTRRAKHNETPLLRGNGIDGIPGKGNSHKGNAPPFVQVNGRPPGYPRSPPSGKGKGKEHKGKGTSFEFEAGRPPGYPGEPEVPVAGATTARATTNGTSATWP